MQAAGLLGLPNRLFSVPKLRPSNLKVYKSSRSSDSWAHVHGALSLLPPSWLMSTAPPVRPLPPVLLPPGLTSTVPSAPCPPPAKSSVSWAHVQCAPQPPVSPRLGFQSPGLMSTVLMSTVPPAACQPPARSSVSWAPVHCALSPLCQVFCLLGSCPLRHQPHVSPASCCALSPLPAPCQPPARPLPNLLLPRLMSNVAPSPLSAPS